MSVVVDVFAVIEFPSFTRWKGDAFVFGEQVLYRALLQDSNLVTWNVCSPPANRLIRQQAKVPRPAYCSRPVCIRVAGYKHPYLMAKGFEYVAGLTSTGIPLEAYWPH